MSCSKEIDPVSGRVADVAHHSDFVHWRKAKLFCDDGKTKKVSIVS